MKYIFTCLILIILAFVLLAFTTGCAGTTVVEDLPADRELTFMDKYGKEHSAWWFIGYLGLCAVMLAVTGVIF